MISSGEDHRMEVSKLQPCATIEGAVFCVGIFNNPFNRVIVRENGRSSNNGMDTGISNSLVGRLVILYVRKVIVVENRVYPRPIYLVGFTDSATSIRKDAKVRFLIQHIPLKILASGNLRHLGVEIFC